VKARSVSGALSFGLLIPDLGETEIFEPICQGMMASPLAHQHALLWGSLTGAAASKEERAWQLCRQYIDRRVSGVFFAPLELTAGKDAVNSKIADALDEARIPLVLLDRTVVPYPQRGNHDLVGIDNRRAGYQITEHLLRLGSRRIAFVAVENAAATVEARAAGYREALDAWDAPIRRELVQRLDPTDGERIRALMASTPDAIVCANDWTAARVMHSVLALGYSVPGDVRLVGIDDLDYASLLPVPLTTLRQPTREIGATAFAAMLDRVSRPDTPVRDILLRTRLVVRRSCGGAVDTRDAAR
jgi:DNA-binding LacI/PurR family transcriptional regulator